MPDIDLVGTWLKETETPCSQLYPERVRFEETGLYFAESDPPGAFRIWDVGSYRQLDGDAILISTANDAEVTYRLTMEGEVLTVTDPDDCSIGFRKQVLP